MNKSVPTLLGIVIILLVAVLVVGIINYRVSQGLGAGEELVGTKGTELLTGEELPEEVISETSALGREERPEPQPSPATRPGTRASERRQGAEGRRGQRRAAEGQAAPPGSP